MTAWELARMPQWLSCPIQVPPITLTFSYPHPLGCIGVGASYIRCLSHPCKRYMYSRTLETLWPYVYSQDCADLLCQTKLWGPGLRAWCHTPQLNTFTKRCLPGWNSKRIPDCDYVCCYMACSPLRVCHWMSSCTWKRREARDRSCP